MKRVGYLYEQLISVENCKQAILNASKNKHNIYTNKNMKYVRRVLDNIDYYALDLSKKLQDKNFLNPYKERTIVDRGTKKERDLKMSKFYPDQCAFHAIKNILEPIILKGSYYWSCANLKGRGIKRAYRGTKRLVRKSKYCAKCDIRHFYQSIRNKLLMALLRRKIKDERFLIILEIVIYSCDGQPIGNVLAPLFAEFFIQDLDRLLCKLGLPHIRYADDITIGGNNKRKLRKTMQFVIEYLSGKELVIKKDYQTFKINTKTKNQKHCSGRKIDFLGYCFSKEYVTIRKRNSINIMRQSRLLVRLKKRKLGFSVHISQSFLSRISSFLYTNSKSMRGKYQVYVKQLKEVVRGYQKCLNLCRVTLNPTF